jgi:hypothetical protein
MLATATFPTIFGTKRALPRVDVTPRNCRRPLPRSRPKPPRQPSWPGDRGVRATGRIRDLFQAPRWGATRDFCLNQAQRRPQADRVWSSVAEACYAASEGLPRLRRIAGRSPGERREGTGGAGTAHLPRISEHVPGGPCELSRRAQARRQPGERSSTGPGDPPHRDNAVR